MRNGAWRRLHTIDACQLLDLSRAFKYEQGSVEQLAILAAQCRNQTSARMRLFSWLVFNVLAGNSDAHLKNLSFLVSSGVIQLAPFYDLLSVTAYGTPAYQKNDWSNRASFAWEILGTRYYEDFDRALMPRTAEIMGISRRERPNACLTRSPVRSGARWKICMVKLRRRTRTCLRRSLI